MAKELTSPLQDYYVSMYCAEMADAFTNLAFFYLAYRGIASCIRNDHNMVFLVGFASYLVNFEL